MPNAERFLLWQAEHSYMYKGRPVVFIIPRPQEQRGIPRDARLRW